MSSYDEAVSRLAKSKTNSERAKELRQALNPASKEANDEPEL